MNSRSLTAAQSRDNVLPTQDLLLAPTQLQSLFWKPRYLVDSDVTIHVPLLYWLCSALWPRSVAVIGADDGMAHFAFCEAMDRLGIEGRCQAVGFWRDAEGDTKAAPPPIDLQNHETRFYEGISSLIPCDQFDQVPSKVSGADLVFWDLKTAPQNNELLLAAVFESMGKDGLLILHGQAQDEPAPRFLEKQSHLKVAIGRGLYLVSKRHDLPSQLDTLTEPKSGSLLRTDIEQIFRRAGQGMDAAAKLEALRQVQKAAVENNEISKSAIDELASLQKSYDIRGAKLVEALSEMYGLRKQSASLGKALTDCNAARDECIAQLEQERQQRQADAASFNRSADDHRASLADSIRECDELRILVKSLSDQLGTLTSLQARAESAETILKTERNTRFQETGQLTRIAEDLRTELEQAKVQISSQKTELERLKAHRKNIEEAMAGAKQEADTVNSALRDEIESIRAENRSLQEHNLELIQSTSWRITAPMRALKTMLTRK